MEGTLKYAVICDNQKIMDWHSRVIKELETLRVGECCAVIDFKDKQNHYGFTFAKKLNVKGIINSNQARVECSGSISAEQVEQIKLMQLDFILNLSSRKIEGDILKSAKYGIWEFNFAPGWRDLYSAICSTNGVIFAALRKLEPGNKYLILKQGHFSALKESVTQSRELIVESAALWPAQVCKDIFLQNANYFNREPEEVVSHYPKQRQKRNLPLFFIKIIGHKMRKIYSRLFRYEYWNVGIVYKPISSILLGDEKMDIQWLIARKDMYLADPFVYRNKDQIRIIMEEVDHRVVKGFISEAALFPNEDKEPNCSFFRETISSSSHMSYPYILEHENEIYCIPETSEKNEVAIYQLKQETGEWKKVRTIIGNFPGVDSTVINTGDCWWLFCTKANSTKQSHNNELYIFYSDDLMGDWQEHQMNPVKIDIRSSRPAGTPFIYGGDLYRPAQDCSETYGGKISLNKIKILTPTQFEEETVKQIVPAAESLYPDGLHTITAAGNMTVLDGKRIDYHVGHFFRKLYKYKPQKIEQVSVQEQKICIQDNRITLEEK